jgi:hypothetical protein
MTIDRSCVSVELRAIDAPLVRRQRLYAAAGMLLIAPLVFWIYRPAAHGLDITGRPIGRDFINVWAGPQLAFGGRLASPFDFEAYQQAIGELFGQPLPFHAQLLSNFQVGAGRPMLAEGSASRRSRGPSLRFGRNTFRSAAENRATRPLIIGCPRGRHVERSI